MLSYKQKYRAKQMRLLTFDLFFKYRAMGKCTCAQAESTEFSLVIWVRLIEIRWSFLLLDLSAGYLQGDI